MYFLIFYNDNDFLLCMDLKHYSYYFVNNFINEKLKNKNN